MSVILSYTPLQRPPWPTLDPFLFCVHHHDAYPMGDEQMRPKASLSGRHIGSDFSEKDGWSMYHGDTVPGFPRHPHRGFETVTIARNGYIDHSDSMGATARFGQGDTQWMTAGSGVVHAEMFPLISMTESNPTELFQIWINLPRVDKMTDAYFTMFWDEKIPRVISKNEAGEIAKITVIAGSFDKVVPLSPPPNSWAAHLDSEVAIWTIELDPHAEVTLPKASALASRALYFFKGADLWMGGSSSAQEPERLKVDVGHRLRVRADQSLKIINGAQPSELLMLQGKPIGEPVVQRGPFVMNTTSEIREAIMDYQYTEFGGWPWDRADPVHSRTSTRFAIHADGRRDAPPISPKKDSRGTPPSLPG